MIDVVIFERGYWYGYCTIEQWLMMNESVMVEIRFEPGYVGQSRSSKLDLDSESRFKI